mgnify:CR=1 FL=1
MVVNFLRAILCVTAVAATAAEPLHVRIDKLVDGGQVGDRAAPSTDAEFVRRIYLGFTGRIPSGRDAGGGAQAVAEALDFMGLEGGQPIAGLRVDVAFIGSCTNGRI